MSVDGKKLKVFLEKLKLYLDELPKDATTIKQAFRLILLTELSQRGTIVDEAILQEEDDKKLMYQVINTAGKAMLDENVVNRAIVAAAGHLSSLILERLADMFCGGISDESKTSIFPLDICDGALKRCKDVDDGRLLILLEMASSHDFISVETLSDQQFVSHHEGMALLLYRLSFGNSLRAAENGNPNAPVMYKRAFDLSVKVNEMVIKLTKRKDRILNKITEEDEDVGDYESFYTRDSITPLSNLIRITEMKQNLIRKFEFSLRIAQSYITKPHQDYRDILAHVGYKLWEDIQLNFIREYQSIQQDSNELELMEKAEEAISDSLDLSDDPPLLLLQKLLRAKVLLTKESSIVDILAEKRFVASRNRMGLSSTESVLGLSEYQELVRRQLLTGTAVKDDLSIVDEQYDLNKMDMAMNDLRDALLASDTDIERSMQHDIHQVLKCGVERLVFRCQSISRICSKQKGKNTSCSHWDEVTDFVQPLMKLDLLGASLSGIQCLLQKIAESVITVAWMHIDSKLFRLGMLEASLSILRHRYDKLMGDEMKRKKELLELEGKVVRTKDVTFVREKSRLEMAINAANCHKLLSEIGDKDEISVEQEKRIHFICKFALASNKQEDKEKFASPYNAAYGNSYLHLLLCWSGLHRQSWSFCNVTESRFIIQRARICLKHSEKEWGRSLSYFEQLLFQMSEADSECVLMGSIHAKATELYRKLLDKIPVETKDPISILFRSHIMMNMARLSIRECVADVCTNVADRMKQQILSLEHIKEEAHNGLGYLRSPSSMHASILHHISECRQLIANAYLVVSKPLDAQNYLLDALEASPQNFDVQFSYGRFCLQTSLYDHSICSDDIRKKSQIHLLKAAKLNVNKADPFALLGLYYELNGDKKRAVGCFSKALSIEASHPVAGRGILRLQSFEESISLCTVATEFGAFQNGWAWKALGRASSLIENDDEKAVICYQQALRCKDIENPKNHSLGIFFFLPDQSHNELCTTWSSLGSCYRRMGKFTASLRAFQAAHESDQNDISFFNTWAQVELELGLLEQAAEKFGKVLLEGDELACLHASFGMASCMMLGSKRDIDEGKYGRALTRLISGINALESLSTSSGGLDHFFVAKKLLGDLHSSASLLPPSVFKDGNDSSSISLFKALELKLDFIRKGETAYQNILMKLNNIGKESRENVLDIHATVFCDLGINKLLQMHVLRELCFEEYGMNATTSKFKSENKPVIDNLFNEAVGAFKDAIPLNPLFSMAWCGLGCALVTHEPLLAQHAFCRALQIDKSGDDSWTNLVLLYLQNHQLDASEEAVDLLTQVADTPMMWIARGLIAEEKAKSMSEVSNASDAYRASLNICQSSQALFGLALTCRWLGDKGKKNQGLYSEELEEYTFRESCANMKMFCDIIGDQSPVPNLFSSIMRSEEIFKLLSQGSHSSMLSEVCKKEKMSIQKTLKVVKEQFCDKKDQDVNNVEKFGTNDIVDLIQTTSDTMAVLESFPVELVSQASTSLSDARNNILLDPDNVDAWLNFSKELVKSAAADNSEEALQSIEAVICRTKNIMETNVTEPLVLHPAAGQLTGNYLSLTERPTESCKFAEACALSHWISDINGNNSNVDLQRSLVLDPTNALARSAL